MERSFSPAVHSEAQRIIAGYRKDAPAFTDAEFYMELRRIVGLADNGHTNVSDSPIHSQFGLLPLRLYWFSDGLYIVRARNHHRTLLGARVEAINARPLGDLQFRTRLMDYVGGSEEFFRRNCAPSLMLSPALLHAVGLAESPEELTLQVKSEAGKMLEVDIQVDRESSAVRAAPWRYLHPAPIEHENGWATFHDLSASPPLYLQQEEKLFRYILIEDDDIAYIQLRANWGPDGNSIDDFLARTQERLERDRPRSIIFDNRQNSGGDLTLTAEFALALPTMASPEGKVYTLTENATFSAGIYTAFFPKAADAQRTIIVGEHVGDRTRFWAETGPSFILRDTGYDIGYSLQMHDLANGCHDPQKCHMTLWPEEWNIAVGSFEPDWPVPMKFADFKAGRDPVLERVLEDVSGHQVRKAR